MKVVKLKPFPETVKQVGDFEKVFGNPDINFPVEEMDLMFETLLKRMNNPLKLVK